MTSADESCLHVQIVINHKIETLALSTKTLPSTTHEMVRNIPSRTALAVVLIGVAVQSSLAFAPLFLVGRAPSLAGQRALGRVHRTYLSEQAQTRKPPGRILLRQTVTCKQEVTSGQVKTVLVVGGGLGGVSVVYDLRHKLRKHDRVILLSDRPAFEFTPSNPWVATRFRKPEDIRVPLAETLSKNGVEFKLGSATTLDAQGRVLTTDAGEAIAYDYLIVATGARLDFDAAPGVREHAVSICTTDHASHAADKWDAFLADDSAKNIVIGCMQVSLPPPHFPPPARRPSHSFSRAPRLHPATLNPEP